MDKNSYDFETFKEKLKENNDIVAIVSKYVNLQRKGKRFWGCCPFHMEKTPSFTVMEEGQYYTCYGCKETGDVINFIMKIEGVDFYDACKILAKEANMQMPVFSKDENALKIKQEKEEIYRCLKEASNYYYNNLKKKEAIPALEYIKKRKLSMQTVDTFQIGYSLGWGDVVTHLLEKGFSLDIIHKSGVSELRGANDSVKSDPNIASSYYDCYAKRLVFPIVNSFGDVVGFSARLLENADFAKYKNTAQTLVFDKSKTIFGIQFIKKLKAENNLKEIIMVEGQMDVISLHQAGVTNAVAGMGTALTSLHAKELKKYSDRVVLSLDGDSAGQKATLRSIDILFKGGLEVFVIKIPEKLDPDEYVQKYGKNSYLELVQNAKYWVEFLIEHHLEDYDITKPNEKTNYISTCLHIIKSLPTESEQSVYINILKDIVKVPVEILQKDMYNVEVIKVEENPELKMTDEMLPSKENAYVKAVKFVMASLIHSKPYAKLSEEIFDSLLNNDYKTMYNYIKNCNNLGKSVIVSNIFDMFDVDNNLDIKDIITYQFNSTIDNEIFYNDCVSTLASYALNRKKDLLLEQIKNCKDLDERKKLTIEFNQLILKSKTKR